MEIEMKSIYEVLINAPKDQQKRLELAYKSIVIGDWEQAITDLKTYQNENYLSSNHNEIECLITHCEKSLR
jgi:hypothetical protein